MLLVRGASRNPFDRSVFSVGLFSSQRASVLVVIFVLMKPIDALNMVAEFHRVFQHPVLKKPQIPPAARAALRVALLEEELEEFKQAINRGDLVEVADALCDLQYVLAGAVLEFGLGEKFPELFAEVQRSNMSKACRSREEALATQRH